MKIKKIICLNCRSPLEDPASYDYMGCPKCKKDLFVSNFTVEYDYAKIKNEYKTKGWRQDLPGIWKYLSLLPLENEKNIVSLGEGLTPLIKLTKFSKLIKVNNLFAKVESINPTATFKDRFATLAVSLAKERGFDTVAAATSGNMGLALSAYAAKAGLKCIIFASKKIVPIYRALLKLYGAKLFILPTMLDRLKLYQKAISEFGWFPASNMSDPPTGNNYLVIEGIKSIAFEIYEQLGNNIPDYVVVPTGWADALYGIWKGFVEMKKIGITKKTPKMIATEAATADPLTVWFSGKKPFYTRLIEGPTKADSIATDLATFQGIKALRESKGFAVSVNDQEMLEMQRALAKKEGIAVELSSATTLKGIEKLVELGKVDKDGLIVTVLSASEKKDLVYLTDKLNIVEIKPNIEDLKQNLSKNKKV